MAMAGLPPVEPATRVAAEEFLIGQAAVLDSLLRRAAEALTETLTTAPDGDERAMRDLSRRELTAVVAADGMVRHWAGSTGRAGPRSPPFSTRSPHPHPPAPPTRRRTAPEWGSRTGAARRRADALVELGRLAGAAAPGAAGGLRPTLTSPSTSTPSSGGSARPAGSPAASRSARGGPADRLRLGDPARRPRCRRAAPRHRAGHPQHPPGGSGGP